MSPSVFLLLLQVAGSAVAEYLIEPKVNQEMQACISPTVNALKAAIDGSSDCKWVAIHCQGITLAFDCAAERPENAKAVPLTLALPMCATENGVSVELYYRMCKLTTRMSKDTATSFVEQKMREKLPKVDLDDFVKFFRNLAMKMFYANKCRAIVMEVLAFAANTAYLHWDKDGISCQNGNNLLSGGEWTGASLSTEYAKKQKSPGLFDTILRLYKDLVKNIPPALVDKHFYKFGEFVTSLMDAADKLKSTAITSA